MDEVGGGRSVGSVMQYRSHRRALPAHTHGVRASGAYDRRTRMSHLEIGEQKLALLSASKKRQLRARM